MKNLNKTICKFNYKGEHYEVDWLTDATSMPDEKECDLFIGVGKYAVCVGHLGIPSKASKKQIRASAISLIEELREANP